MRKEYYEAHITILGEPSVVRPFVEAEGWTFSAIDGDPTLGRGLRCYATKHFNAREGAAQHILTLSQTARSLSRHVIVLREKLELVVYDYKPNI